MPVYFKKQLSKQKEHDIVNIVYLFLFLPWLFGGLFGSSLLIVLDRNMSKLSWFGFIVVKTFPSFPLKTLIFGRSPWQSGTASRVQSTWNYLRSLEKLIFPPFRILPALSPNQFNLTLNKTRDTVLILNFLIQFFFNTKKSTRFFKY